MKTFSVKTSETVCPRCGKITLSPREILKIRVTGQCFTCDEKEKK